jgi:hypothetical protein
MQLRKLLQELDKLNLPIDQYAITSSGPMAAHGIREANDLDIILTPTLYERLKTKYKVGTSKYGEYMEINEHVQGIGEFLPEYQQRSNVDQIKDADILFDHPFIKLEDVIAFKKMLGREKDMKDIALIEDFLSGLPQ